MSEEIVIIGDVKAAELFQTEGGLDFAIDEVKGRVKSFYYDIRTKDSRKSIASFAAKIAKAKVRADEAGKNLNTERRTLNEKVDERRRQLREDFDRMRDQAKKEVVEYEAKVAAEEQIKLEAGSQTA